MASQVYEPKDSGSAPVRSKDETILITDREKILARWAEHFQTVLNQPSIFDFSVLSEFPQLESEVLQPKNHDLGQSSRCGLASIRK